MQFQDYYKILQVERTATNDEIKKSYRKLAMRYHPDKNPGNLQAEEKFKKIAEAYEVLTDEEKRRKFDDFLKNQSNTDHKEQTKNKHAHQKQEPQHTTRQRNKEDEDLLKEFYKRQQQKKGAGFSDFFKQFFSGNDAEENVNTTKGKDVYGKISIELEEAYAGSTRIINLSSEKLRIKIKPGIKHEQILKVKERGEAGIPAGDLFIRIVLKPHSLYQRKENDLYRDLWVDIYTVILGGKVEFTTLKGNMSIVIPEGIENEKLLRIKGAGMPDYDNPETFGDLYLVIKYAIPKNPTGKEKTLLEQLRKIKK